MGFDDRRSTVSRALQLGREAKAAEMSGDHRKASELLRAALWLLGGRQANEDIRSVERQSARAPEPASTIAPTRQDAPLATTSALTQRDELDGTPHSGMT
jgi:hypothetical protein